MRDEITRTTVRLPKELHIRLKKEAADQNRTIEDLIRSAIERELSGPASERFAAAPHGDGRRLLRDLEKELGEYLERIRNTLSVPDIEGHEFAANVAKVLLECLPVPVLVRETDGAWSWRNPAYREALEENERGNLGSLDGAGRDSAGFCTVELYTPGNQGQLETTTFDSWQFSFFDSEDQRYRGDLLLPHNAVSTARQERELLLPLPQTLRDLLSHPLTAHEEGVPDRLSSFLEAIPVSVAVKDVGGRYQWANPFFLEKIAKKQLKEIVGRKPGELFNVTGIAAIDEQETVVKVRKMGLLAPAPVNRTLMRVGLRFPLLDSQGRVTYLGALGIDRPYAIDHIADAENGAQA